MSCFETMKHLLLLLLVTAPAYARTLSWDHVAVKAHLDDAGSLHVREEQGIVFDGDWNGGERVFRIERGQTFTFERISRLDSATGTLIPLREGSLDAVDDYQFTDAQTLRWRSRLPSDPPFRNQRITYILEYTLGNILLKSGSQYVLDHDFAFPKRDGEIRRFTLDLDLGSSWQPVDLKQRVAIDQLPPGKSVVVRGTLQYGGATAPQSRRSTFPLRLAFAALALGVPIVLWRRFVGRETAMGRLAPLTTSTMTPRWIEENLLPIPAEIAGTAWDEDAGANEVSALLARWAAEGKIRTTVDADSDLQMELLASRDTFPDYERALIDKLFFQGNTTSTAAIRDHYKSSGFNPGSLVGRHLIAKANTLAAMSEAGPKINKLPTLILFGIAVILFKLALTDSFVAIAGLWLLGVMWMIAGFTALRWRGRIDHGLRQTRSFVIPLAISIIAVVAIILANSFSLTAQLGYVAAVLMITNNVFNVAKAKRGPSAIAFRKRLASVREYFVRELQKSTPAIDDRWFPYLVAFGLNDEATAWMTAFGERTTSSFSHSSSSSSSPSSSPQWTGGGGAFGGAGATGSWTAAAAGMAAGVAGASSSGGGGGGGSSGGGGGGGW
jgi:uncharacterized membrane protein YgcG